MENFYTETVYCTDEEERSYMFFMTQSKKSKLTISQLDKILTVAWLMIS